MLPGITMQSHMHASDGHVGGIAPCTWLRDGLVGGTAARRGVVHLPVLPSQAATEADAVA